MTAPSPQRYLSYGRRANVDEIVLQNSLAAMKRIKDFDPRITPVLTLMHLSQLSDTPFPYLRAVVARSAPNTYKFFYLKKRIPGRNRVRMISAPSRDLMNVQRWIVDNILRFTTPHSSSYAFHPECRPYEAAELHCGCTWLLKIDIEEFFHSISEGRVAALFSCFGFSKLISFEMARIVTVSCERLGRRPESAIRWPAIPYYQCASEGILPQGAPTSPMISNLIMYRTDEVLSRLAELHGMKYTRYADDLAFSCGPERNEAYVRRFARLVLAELRSAGFRPNHQKTSIRGPGSRRIVLGMLVDSERPRLAREFKDMIKLHLYYLKSPSHGPSLHASARKTSVSGIFHHVRGLISWAEIVEPEYGKRALTEFESVSWPIVQPYM